jgi:citrate synthase
MAEDIETSLSEVDGDNGRLTVCGRSLDDLAGRATYEDMLTLLWGTDAGHLGPGRLWAWQHLQAHWPVLLHTAPMDAMRAALSLLPVPTSHLAEASRLSATLGVVVAGLALGRCPDAPHPQVSHAADILRMMRGAPATPAEVAGLDGYLVTVAEHGMNASTYTARVIASTQAGVRPAVVGALCALQGPLHGGAPGPVLDMLDSIGTAASARSWLSAELQAGRRLMGFGHRIYRVRDPRADALKGLLHALRGERGAERLALAESVERDALDLLRESKPDRRLETNVEFFTALLLEALGVPRTLFTPVFACGRVLGWCAHVREQEDHGHLIRPRSTYRPAVHA